MAWVRIAGAVQVQASCRGEGLPVQADSLACLCSSWGGCLRESVLDALLGLVHDEACGADSQRLVAAVKGGLLPWLMSGAEPQQVRDHTPRSFSTVLDLASPHKSLTEQFEKIISVTWILLCLWPPCAPQIGIMLHGYSG